LKQEAQHEAECEQHEDGHASMLIAVTGKQTARVLGRSFGHGGILPSMLKLSAALLLTAFAVPAPQDPTPSPSPPASDTELVRRAALDYVEGIYEVKPDYIERSVHKDLVKYGLWRQNESKPYAGSAMTKPQLLELAKKWNASGNRANSESLKEVELLDVLDQTAVAKVSAAWGIDYMQLAKFDGTWQILHIMWQSHPPKTSD
jgi:hypothetical protein